MFSVFISLFLENMSKISSYKRSIIGIGAVFALSFVALATTNAATCTPSALARVSFGQQNSIVANMQQCLIDTGFSIPAGATGYYGIQTRAAVQSFYASALAIADWDGNSMGPQGRATLGQKITNGVTPPCCKPLVTGNGTVSSGDVVTGINTATTTPPPPPLPGTDTKTFSGTLVCLPHKNTSGPQTMECAYGLHDDSGVYYSLRDSDPNYSNIMSAPMNTPVTVTGTLTLQDDAKYQSIGVIAVTSIVVKK